MVPEELLTSLGQTDPGVERRSNANLPAVTTPVDSLLNLMRILREKSEYSFDLLLTHTAIDWQPQALFELVYIVYSTVHGHKLLVTTYIPRSKPVAPSVSAIWPTAHWQEREAYDMFGIDYDNHPDLRRVFLEDDWNGFPLRKDYRDAHMLERPE